MPEWFQLDAFPNNHILAKLVLLAATVGLALHARLRVLPGLDDKGLSALAWHVIPVTILSVLLVAVGVGLRGDGLF